jgi:alpha-tubulin suppressor-like RCC1 family protein
MIKIILTLLVLFTNTLISAQDVSIFYLSTLFACEDKLSVSGLYSPDGESFERYNAPHYLYTIEHAVAVTKFLDAQIVLDNNEQAWVWGNNKAYSLGLGHDSLVIKPTINPLLNGTKTIETSDLTNTIFAIKDDNNELWAWGNNDNALVANSEEDFVSTPIYLEIDNIADVAAGPDNAIALKKDGSVWVWGLNGLKQMGIDSVFFSRIPLQLEGLPGITQISSEYHSSVIIDSTGQAWGWGLNYYGNLGKDDFAQISTPEKIAVMTGVKQVATMRAATIWTDSLGQAWSMGENYNGQLGVGDKVKRDTASPQKIELPAPVKKLFTKEFSAIALLENGELWAWGDNTSKQLGIGPSENLREYLPVKVYDPCAVVNSIKESTHGVLSVYPNPSTNGRFALKTESPSLSWEVYSLDGQKINTGISTTIDIARHKNGMYLLHWKTKTEQGTSKLMLQ